LWDRRLQLNDNRPFVIFIFVRPKSRENLLWMIQLL
jgi:hypothetical protein